VRIINNTQQKCNNRNCSCPTVILQTFNLSSLTRYFASRRSRLLRLHKVECVGWSTSQMSTLSLSNSHFVGFRSVEKPDTRLHVWKWWTIGRTQAESVHHTSEQHEQFSLSQNLTETSARTCRGRRNVLGPRISSHILWSIVCSPNHLHIPNSLPSKLALAKNNFRDVLRHKIHFGTWRNVVRSCSSSLTLRACLTLDIKVRRLIQIDYQCNCYYACSCKLGPWLIFTIDYVEESVHGKDPVTSTYGHNCAKDAIT
jgi:hypothetical protein